MAWFRPMGVDEVAYHQATVVGRADDHPGAALDYYGSRGETPLRWRGAGAARLGLIGDVSAEAYEAAFGPGGFRDPNCGSRLVGSRRPGFELVIGAHKSVALLGVVGHADAMHSILDVETAATMATLDAWFQERGGRRGRAQERTATGGLVYAITRHATSRAGDPAPHDHVLVANIVEMLDAHGGFKGLDSAALRDTVEAATMVGRLHAAAHAASLGFRIERDDGPSGNLRHWRIAAVPEAVCELFSKRSDEIAEHLAESGREGYRARAVAARATRSTKRHTGVDELLATWRRELLDAGHHPDRLARDLSPSADLTPEVAPGFTPDQLNRLIGEVLDIDGPLLRRHKTFTRTQFVAELAPRLYGHDPAELDRALARVPAFPDVIPLIGTGCVRERVYTTRAVLEAEHTIAQIAAALADRPGLHVSTGVVDQTVANKERELGWVLTAGQRELLDTVCRGDRTMTLVVGIAGSGKTTALDAAAAALHASGYRVLGVSTSGQAARTLGAEANIDASTLASMLHRLDSGRTTLDARTMVIADEAGMAADADLARLLLAASRTGASVVLVGDDRQLPAVGPGGAFTSLLRRHADLVVTLDGNVRQHDLAERHALAHLRDGDVRQAISWYEKAGRITTVPARTDTLVSMAAAWADDVAGGQDTALLAWRRADVADLNRLARHRWDQLGRLTGPDIEVTGGRRYAAGDRIVATAPNHAAGIVTSQRLTITSVDPRVIGAVTDDGRSVSITGAGLDRDHLDYGYALTVHRSQGLTCDRAHVLANGGGRELAYVAASRARRHTQIHLTAPHPSDAGDALLEQWAASRDEQWITDTDARPGTEPAPNSTAASLPVDLASMTEHALEYRLRSLQSDLHDLCSGTGRWTATPEGVAAGTALETTEIHERTQQVIADPRTRRRDRRLAERGLGELAIARVAAQQDRDRLVNPIVSALQQQIGAAHDELRRREAADLIQILDRYSADVPAIDRQLSIEL